MISFSVSGEFLRIFFFFKGLSEVYKQYFRSHSMAFQLFVSMCLSLERWGVTFVQGHVIEGILNDQLTTSLVTGHYLRQESLFLENFLKLTNEGGFLCFWAEEL